jgi:hypothetical protein
MKAEKAGNFALEYDELTISSAIAYSTFLTMQSLKIKEIRGVCG